MHFNELALTNANGYVKLYAFYFFDSFSLFSFLDHHKKR